MDETRGTPEPGSDAQVVISGAQEPPPDPRPQFDRRASNVLIILALLAVLGGLLVAGVVGTAPTLARIVVVVLAVASGIAAGAVSVALDRRRTWAPATAVPLLWLIAVGGVLRFVVGLSAASLQVPLDALFAMWALNGAGRPPGVLPAGRQTVGAALLAVAMTGQLAGPAATVLSTPGLSPFIVDRSALDGRLLVSCVPDGAGTSAGLSVRVSWTWAHRDAFPEGLDVVGVAFAVPGPDATTLRFDPTSVRTEDAGLTFGGGGASGDLVNRELAGMNEAATWLVDIGRDGLRDDALSFRLVESTTAGVSAMVASGVQVRVVYAHGGRWAVSAETTCGS